MPRAYVAQASELSRRHEHWVPVIQPENVIDITPLRLRPIRDRPINDVPLPGDAEAVLDFLVKEAQFWDEFLTWEESRVSRCAILRSTYGAPSDHCICDICFTEGRPWANAESTYGCPR